MKRIAAAFGPLGALALLACGTEAPIDGQSLAPRLAVPILELPALEPYRTHSGFRAPARLVIREQAAWTEAWSTIVSGSEPAPVAPAVNFDQFMVLLAAAGSRGSGGHSIEVRHVTEDSAELAVEVEAVSPGATCVVTMGFTQPLHAVLVPARAGAVRFVERQRVEECM
jgi:hypothetical protein